MSTLERGFKTWCERRAKSLREDLGLTEDAPLDIFSAARHLGITVLSPKDIDGMTDQEIRHLLMDDADGWSAVTVELAGHKIVVFNPSHSKGRQASDVAHEVAHVLLKHEGSISYLAAGESGMLLRTYDAKREQEADWLGWTLLLPRVALVRAREQRATFAQLAMRYGVSEPLVRFRLQRTGVDVQLRRRRSDR